MEKPTRSCLPDIRLSLHDAIQAAVDNNVSVRLLNERIAAAQDEVDTSLGAQLPNMAGYVNERNQTVNLAAFGLHVNRLAGPGLTRSVTDPFEVYDTRATKVQNPAECRRLGKAHRTLGQTVRRLARLNQEKQTPG